MKNYIYITSLVLILSLLTACNRSHRHYYVDNRGSATVLVVNNPKKQLFIDRNLTKWFKLKLSKDRCYCLEIENVTPPNTKIEFLLVNETGVGVILRKTLDGSKKSHKVCFRPDYSGTHYILLKPDNKYHNVSVDVEFKHHNHKHNKHHGNECH